jgi:hypothetical protein
MIIKSCVSCRYHEMKRDGGEETSHCQKENCWSRYSKCVLGKALEKFLKEESSRSNPAFFAMTHMYSQE